MLEFWINEAFSWGERRNVPVSVKRDEMGDWYLLLEFKDREGQFFGRSPFIERDFVKVEGSTKKRRETDEEYGKRICGTIEKVCARARAKRIEEFTKTGDFKKVA